MPFSNKLSLSLSLSLFLRLTGFHANIKSNENGIETGELGSATITKL